MDDEDYKKLVELSTKLGGSLWSCMSCTNLGSNLAKRVDAHDGAIAKLEEDVGRVNSEMTEVIDRINTLEAGGFAANSGGGGATLVDMVAELQAMEVRKNNILMHGTPSAPSTMTTAVARKNYDMTLILMILSDIGVNIVQEDIKFFRRIKKKEDTRPDRPIVIGLKDPDKKAEIMIAAKHLSNSQYNYVGISHDLTKVQREVEANLKAEADQKNQANALLPPTEKQNIEFRVVGRLGARQVRAIPLGTASGRPAYQTGAAGGGGRPAGLGGGPPRLAAPPRPPRSPAPP